MKDKNNASVFAVLKTCRMYTAVLLISMQYVCCVVSTVAQTTLSTTVLYNRTMTDQEVYPELMNGDRLISGFTSNGLSCQDGNAVIKLNYYYTFSERFIRYHVRFSNDAVGVFQSDKGDFKAMVDVVGKRIVIETNPITEKEVAFLDPAHDYLVEIHRDYQTSALRIVDMSTGAESIVSAVMDGTGGVGRGAAGTGFHVGLQHDYYCFGLQSGTEMLVKQLTVLSKKSNLALLIYGDSITEPEGYFPTSDFPQAWTQLIINALKGKAMSSGRGGTTIHEVLERIKNELPYVKAKYVMVTIGTNGGNTEENLSELVEYIQSQGSIPILNNIPANESGTQVPVNAMIEKVRQRYGIKGCKFDLATSIGYDGREVDKSTMYFEDYDWGEIYHHPNVKGSRLMYLRTLVDVPEIYE